MGKVCLSCGDVLGEKFCTKCGEKMKDVPCCNWHWYPVEIWPYMKHCPNCGRTREKALHTSPQSVYDRLKKVLKISE